MRLYLFCFKHQLAIVVEQVASEAGITSYQCWPVRSVMESDDPVLRKMMLEMSSLMTKMRWILETLDLRRIQNNLMEQVCMVVYQYLELVGL